MAAESLAAIILAGGLSTRMGEDNKLHLPVGDGVPLLRHCAQTLLQADLQEVVIVLGYQSECSKKLVSDLPVRTVFNEQFATGQMSSVQCGLESLQGNHSGVFVVLSDQPALQPYHFGALREAFLKRRYGDVVVPFFQGQRGNPILISESCRRSILAGERNLGCRRFIDKNPELVVRVDMPDSAVLNDLDTPSDYQQFQMKEA